MSSKLCIHGHFYQPPRFDPWLEEVLPEPSAAPFQNWNQRINRECYAPLAFARRVDSQGFVLKMINCYEFISYNYGPTILRWMEQHAPDVYARVLEGDRKSAERLGKGNAMAQIYHHIIMPLSTDQDRDIEIQWSIADFEHRYKRSPEGMWLSEAAVCTDTLEALARAGISYTILAPRQAEAVCDLDSDDWQEVDEQSLDTDQPYLVRLPSGQEIAVFFYDGPLSQAVAFERLLSDGGVFWGRILDRKHARLVSLATDGESYGHHFKFGEMSLAYVLEQALSPQSPLELTNYGAYLDHNPPKKQVRIKENSSWSCIHGIERWRRNCGCTNGGHPGWNQLWRKPLRRALNLLKYYIDHHFRQAGPAFFKDEQKALLDYGRCLCNAVSMDEFLENHQQAKLSDADRVQAFKLLEAQRAGLASFSSCAWFFDDIARIEPLNSLSYALKGMDLLRELNGPDVEDEFLEVLEEAYSNDLEAGDGRKIWTDLILPRRINVRQMAAVGLGLEGQQQRTQFPGLCLEVGINGSDINVDYHWVRTGEKGRGHFQLSEPDDQSGIIKAIDNIGDQLSLEIPDSRLVDYILCIQDNAREDAAWENLLKQAGLIQKMMRGAFAEGQNSPLAGLGMLSLGIVLIYLCSEDDYPDFESFWKAVFKDNRYFREILAKRVARELEEMTDQPEPDWEKGARLASRSFSLGIFPDLFNVQNRLWLLGQEGTESDIFEQFFINIV